MPMPPNAANDDGPLTLTEQARRAQLIEATIQLVADRGYSGTSLAAIARSAGITKAAVLYHFRSKDALVHAAYQHTLDLLVTDVAGAVEATDAAAGPAAYIRSMIAHLGEHPRHTRMIIEAITEGDTDRDQQARWQALAQIMHAAAQSRGSTSVDTRTLAIIASGGIDAIVAERLRDPDYDTAFASEQLIKMVECALSA